MCDFFPLFFAASSNDVPRLTQVRTSAVDDDYNDNDDGDVDGACGGGGVGVSVSARAVEGVTEPAPT